MEFFAIRSATVAASRSRVETVGAFYINNMPVIDNLPEDLQWPARYTTTRSSAVGWAFGGFSAPDQAACAEKQRAGSVFQPVNRQFLTTDFLGCHTAFRLSY